MVSASVSHGVLREPGLLICRLVGQVGDEELLAGWRRIHDDPRSVDVLKRLVDPRQLEGAGLTAAALAAAARFSRDRCAGRGVTARTAFVAPKNVAFGLARMYEALMHGAGGEIMVFRKTEEACAWLGVAPELLDRALQDHRSHGAE